MTGRGALAILVRGLGVAAGLITCSVVAAAAVVALGLPEPGRADDVGPAPVEPRPAELVVALSLGDRALQAGVVKGGEVVLARGLEVELARRLARSLRIPAVRFLDVRPSSRLLAAGDRPWHLAIAAVRPTREARAANDLSDPYLVTDQAVILRRGIARLRSLGELRRLVTCAGRGSAGAAALFATVRPLRRPRLAPSEERLLQLVQTGVCDAALVDGVAVGRLAAGRGALLGPIAARVRSGKGLVVAVTRGGAVPVTDVDGALRRLRADGTLHRLARAWLGIDPARLTLLR